MQDNRELFFDSGYLFLSAFSVVFRYSLDFQFGEHDQVFLGHRTKENMFEWLESLIDGFQYIFPGFAIFNGDIQPVFNKDLLQRAHMPFAFQLFLADKQFLAKKLNRILGRNPYHI